MIGQNNEIRKAVVTGATSSIGLYLVKQLGLLGTETFCLVHPGSIKNELLTGCPNVHMIECDLKDINADLSKYVPKCDCFFNIGWIKPKNDTKNSDGHLLNIRYSENAAKLAIALDCNTFIGIGSQSECGNNPDPIDIHSPSNPECSYARAKIKAMESTVDVCKVNGVKCIWPRLLSSYGPYDRETTLIMNCIRACYNDIRLELTPCEQEWDYIYSEDVARALIAIAINGKDGKRYPIASGNSKPLKEYIATIAQVFERDLSIFGIGKKPYPPDQCMHLSADISELEKDTGFFPSISFKEGIQHMKQWADSTGYFFNL